MATTFWRGDAPAVAQVTQWVFAGTSETNDIIRVIINGKTVQVTTGSATIATYLATLLAALQASTIPEFAEITWSISSPNLIATAKTAGLPFTATVYLFESDGTTPGDSQTVDGAASSAGTDSTACSGPTFWSVAANWSGGAVPVDTNDVIFTNSNNDCLDGLAQTGVTLASLTIDASYTGKIGRPRLHGSGATAYVEYRATYLAVKATTVTIGNGVGNGSGRIKLDQSTAQTTVTVNSTGQPLEAGVKAMLWKGTHASNVVNVNKGSVGIAFYKGDTSVVATLREGYVGNSAGDADVSCGADTTLTTITKTGGALALNSSFTTLNQGPGNAGTTILYAGTPGTINCTGGLVDDRTTGTLTAGVITGPGQLDRSKDNRPKTYTNLTLNPGCTFLDPNETVTFTNPMTIVGTLADKTVDLGANFTLQRG